MITDDELGATILAGQPWARDRDIPDPVGWADLAHDVGVTVEVIRGRNGEKYTPVRAHTLPLHHGRILGDLAADNDRNWVPVKCAAAEAWSRSDAWNVGSATEAALRVGDSQQRRALALTLRRANAGRNVNIALRKLRSCVPESRPAVIWIRDGGSLAA